MRLVELEDQRPEILGDIFRNLSADLIFFVLFQVKTGRKEGFREFNFVLRIGSGLRIRNDLFRIRIRIFLFLDSGSGSDYGF